MSAYTIGVTQSVTLDVPAGSVVTLSTTTGVGTSYTRQTGPAGSTTVAPGDFPLLFNESVNLAVTTAGTALTVTVDPNPSQAARSIYIPDYTRSWNPAEYFIRQHADRAAFTSDTNQQALFDAVANGSLTLPVGAYFFECHAQVKATSATSGNVKFSLLGAGGATLANILYSAMGIDAANDTLTAFSGVSEIISTQTATNLATASTATVTTFLVTGSFEVTVAGTLIPSIAQTSADVCVTTAGSYFRARSLGPAAVVSFGPWS